MNLVRQYKFHRLGIKVPEEAKSFCKIIDSNFLNLRVYTTEKPQSRIYYLNKKKEGIFIFEESDVNHFLVNYEGLWRKLENGYKMDKEEIRAVIKQMADYFFGIDMDENFIFSVGESWFVETLNIDFEKSTTPATRINIPKKTPSLNPLSLAYIPSCY